MGDSEASPLVSSRAFRGTLASSFTPDRSMAAESDTPHRTPVKSPQSDEQYERRRELFERYGMRHSDKDGHDSPSDASMEMGHEMAIAAVGSDEDDSPARGKLARPHASPSPAPSPLQRHSTLTSTSILPHSDLRTSVIGSNFDSPRTPWDSRLDSPHTPDSRDRWSRATGAAASSAGRVMRDEFMNDTSTIHGTMDEHSEYGGSQGTVI